MSTFPGDMSIGWGFGLEGQEEEPQPTDPLLAVSELEQRVDVLEERLRSLTIVVDVLIEQAHHLAHDEGRIDGHRAILVTLMGKVDTLEHCLDVHRTSIDSLNREVWEEAEKE